MPGAPLRRENAASITLAQRIYAGVCSEIVSGKLKPGALLSRRQVAASYGTSYIPVVEAMVRLENAGLIEAESSQMARVCNVTIEAIEDAYVLREALETQAIRMACVSVTDEEIAELRRLAQELEAVIARLNASRGKQKPPEGPQRHFEFHRRIAQISRCPALVRELERIELQRRLRANWVYVPGKNDPPGHHVQLVEAIRHRNAVAADKVMRAHVRSGLERELAGYRIQATALSR